MQVEGIGEVIKLFKEIDLKTSRKALTKGTKEGVKIARNDARKNAPVDTGTLKKSIKQKAEKYKKGKRVYRLGFVGEGLVKVSAEGKRAFYPASQEYGFMTRDGNKIIPPTAGFLRGAIDNNREAIKKTMIKTMIEELRKVR